MARQEIILGTPPLGLGGDPPRVASMKLNAMTLELYQGLATPAAPLPITKGGTGGKTAAEARANLGAVGLYDYGLGSSLTLPAGSDLNTLVAPGEYAFTSGSPSPANSPESAAQYVTVIGRSSYPYQEVRPIYGNKLWFRSAKTVNPTVAAHWNEWVCLASGAIGNPIPNADANALFPTGVYTVGAAWVGSPTPGTVGGNQGYLSNEVNIIGTYVRQTFTSLNTGVYLTRKKVVGVWGEWETLVSIYGANGNGEFVRLPDGTQICWTNTYTTLPSMAPYGSTGFFRGVLNWTFPVAFASAPVITGSGQDSSEYGWLAGGGTTASFGAPYYVTRTNNPTSIIIRMTAVGRWK